jgi:hypothetical protein
MGKESLLVSFVLKTAGQYVFAWFVPSSQSQFRLVVMLQGSKVK